MASNGNKNENQSKIPRNEITSSRNRTTPPSSPNRSPSPSPPYHTPPQSPPYYTPPQSPTKFSTSTDRQSTRSQLPLAIPLDSLPPRALQAFGSQLSSSGGSSGAPEPGKWSFTRPSDQLPEIVQRYQNPITGEPNIELIENDIKNDSQRFKVAPNRCASDILAERFRKRTINIIKPQMSKTDRKQSELAKMGFSKINGRYQQNLSFDKLSENDSFRPRMTRSQSMSDLSSVNEVNRRIKGMGKRKKSNLMPTGRLDYGMPWNSQRLRSSSLDNLNIDQIENKSTDYYSPREQAFASRLSVLPKEELETYKSYRNMADISHTNQKAASNRMIFPWTQYGQSVEDQEMVKKIQRFQRAFLVNDQLPQGIVDRRAYRRRLAKQRSSLPSADPNIKFLPIGTIGETSDDESEPMSRQLNELDRRFQKEMQIRNQRQFDPYADQQEEESSFRPRSRQFSDQQQQEMPEYNLEETEEDREQREYIEWRQQVLEQQRNRRAGGKGSGPGKQDKDCVIHGGQIILE